MFAPGFGARISEALVSTPLDEALEQPRSPPRWWTTLASRCSGRIGASFPLGPERPVREAGMAKKPINEHTSKKVASKASKLLSNPKTPKAVKSVAASALTQARSKPAAKKR